LSAADLPNYISLMVRVLTSGSAALLSSVYCLPYEMRSIFHWGEAYFTGEFCILPIEVFRSILVVYFSSNKNIKTICKAVMGSPYEILKTSVDRNENGKHREKK